MYRIYSILNVTFILNRATGIALLVYFLLHVLAISTALIAGPESFSRVMRTFAQPGFRAVEIAIAGCALYHALNGLHIVLAERGLLPRDPRMAKAVASITLAVWIVAGVSLFL